MRVSRCRRIAGVDVFWTLMLISAAAVPLALLQQDRDTQRNNWQELFVVLANC